MTTLFASPSAPRLLAGFGAAALVTGLGLFASSLPAAVFAAVYLRAGTRRI